MENLAESFGSLEKMTFCGLKKILLGFGFEIMGYTNLGEENSFFDFLVMEESWMIILIIFDEYLDLVLLKCDEGKEVVAENKIYHYLYGF